MRERTGEPISRGQLDRRAMGGQGFRDSLFLAAFFGGVVLIDGILAMLLIELFQAIGWWEIQGAGSASGDSELGSRVGGSHRRG